MVVVHRLRLLEKDTSRRRGVDEELLYDTTAQLCMVVEGAVGDEGGVMVWLVVKPSRRRGGGIGSEAVNCDGRAEGEEWNGRYI